MNLYRHFNKIDREAIDEFFAARVARQKGLRASAVDKKILLILSNLEVNHEG